MVLSDYVLWVQSLILERIWTLVDASVGHMLVCKPSLRIVLPCRFDMQLAYHLLL